MHFKQGGYAYNVGFDTDVFKCKYGDKIENRWFWMFVALAILAWIIAYSFYCTSQGHKFGWEVRLFWTDFRSMGIKCE